ncbi:GNAT family N-acetyltransferase [candidate division GN15 bacterium]|nr:GNAT family N-acetyltransferase [candidate division GN15 bacterium]
MRSALAEGVATDLRPRTADSGPAHRPRGPVVRHPRLSVSDRSVVLLAYRRQGIGRYLMNSVMSTTAGAEKTHAALRVAADNSVARRLSERLGFVEWVGTVCPRL